MGDFQGVRTELQVRQQGVISPYMRAGKMGEIVTSDGKGRYAEAVLQGNVYSLCLPVGTTAISAGNLNAAAANAATQFAIWNPVNSGKILSLLKFAVSVVSGTAPVSGIYHSISKTASTIASAATTGNIHNNLIGSANVPVAGYLTSAAGSALTGSTALEVVRHADMYFSAGTFAALGGQRAVEYIDGDILLMPNTCWVPTWQAAGTTMLVGYSITWEELPFPSNT